MSDTLVETLRANSVSTAIVPHAMRYYISARSKDLPVPQMRAVLLDAGIASSDLERAVNLLERDAALLDSASLFVLQDAFGETTTRDMASGAIGASRSKLPVIEAGLIAIVAVYGMWLATTKGKRFQQRVLRRKADGSIEETETTEWYGPSGPLRAIAGIFGTAFDPPAPPAELPDDEPASEDA